MRVTESSLITLATVGLQKNRDRAADAGAVVNSGVSVARPSDNAAAWAEGMRAQSRVLMSGQRGSGIERGVEGLSQTDASLGSISTIMQQVTQLAVEATNGTMSAGDMARTATQIDALRDAALAAANARGPDGEYLLAGANGKTAPFTAAGVYTGDAQARSIEASEANRTVSTVPGSVLTAASGVDVFAVLSTLSAALTAGDQATARATLAGLGQAVSQVADARTLVGSRMAALQTADAARKSFESTLAQTHARAVEADPIAAASAMSQAAAALEGARSAAQELVKLGSGQ